MHSIELKSFDSSTLDWSKGDGLLPAIVQHAGDGRVLMLGYMNRKALERTMSSRQVTFYSRSRRRLWTKGETSGNVLNLKSVHVDCDKDTVLVMAEPQGPTCHLGSETCFGDAAQPRLSFLDQLDRLVAAREIERPEGSYTTRLFDSGIRRIAQKVGEEGVETALAAVAQDEQALREESADLIYHLLVLLHAHGLDLAAVTTVLRSRHQP